MAKRDKLQDALDALGRLRTEIDPAALQSKLRDAIGHSSNLIVAKAVKMAREKKLLEFAEVAAAQFARFMEDGGEADPGCSAKSEIVRLLLDAQTRCEDLYLQGVQHRQLEAGWGKPNDTAAEVRGLCGMGLVCLGSRKAMRIVCELLFDTEKATRSLAVKCAAASRASEASLLLRAKCLAGDTESEVLADALTAVVSVEGADGLSFVARFLSSSEDMIAESAALAIGESKSAEAFDLLRKAYRDVSTSHIRGAILLGMAITRNPAAVDLLIDAIVSGHLALASDAVRAGALFRQDEGIVKRLDAAVRARGTPALITEWETAIRSRP